MMSSVCPSRFQFRAPLRVLLLLAVALAASGCNYFIAAAYLIGGPPSIEPDFDHETGKSMTAKDVTVVVLCYAPKEVKFDFHDVDYEMAKYVANQMFRRKIQVINPDRVHDWLDRNPDWNTPAEIGAYFKSTYVVNIELSSFSLYEKDSVDLYRGRSEATVSVWEMDEDKEDGEPIFSRDITSVYPLATARSTYDTKYTAFKRQYLERLSEEIGRLFYEHYHGDDIPDAY